MKTLGTHRQMVLVALLALSGSTLRLVGLGHREPTVDELHYRGDMSNTIGFLRNHSFRNHSVRHPQGQVPHGLLAPAFAFGIGRSAHCVFRLSFPDAYEQDNFLSRLGYALSGIALMLLMFFFGKALFGIEAALMVLALAAFSPILVNWSRSEYLDTPMTFFLIASFFCLWGVLNGQRRPRFLALFCGVCAGLALASKWSALVVLPAIPFAYLLIQWRQRGAWEWTRADLAILLCFVAGLALASWTFLSIDSFRWAIFPPAGASYGDKNMPFLTRLMLGLQATWDLRMFAAIGIYWLGLLFLPLLIFSMTQALLDKSSEALLLLVIFLIGLPLTIIQEGFWDAWRATYPLAGAILLIGWGFSRLRWYRGWVFALTLLLMIPITLRDGLRLRPALIRYHSSQFTYDTPLPPLNPNIQVFH